MFAFRLSGCILILCLMSPSPAHAGYRWPIDRPKRITGTFCEPRGIRFHMGIDVSSGGTRGYRIFAADKGYVSTVMYQKWGIGYAVFVTHPDGRRSFYGHMDRFPAYILSHPQLKKYSDDILNRTDFRIDFDRPVLPVRKGALIGFSGDSGLGKAHFHFELRDSTDTNLNPLRYGIKINDNLPPKFIRLYIVPLDPYSHVNGMTEVLSSGLKFRKGVYTLPTGSVPVVAGKIGIKVKLYDRTGYSRKVAVYRLKILNRGKILYSHSFDRLEREKRHHLGLFYDLDHTNNSVYTHYLYSRVNGSGIIDTRRGFAARERFTVEACDASLNCSRTNFTLSRGQLLKTPAYTEKFNLKPGRSLSIRSGDRKFMAFFERTSAFYREHVVVEQNPPVPLGTPGLSSRSRLYILYPTNLCINAPAEISISYRRKDASKTGLYMLDPLSNSYYFISNYYNRYRKRFVASALRMGGYFLARDDYPPDIQFRPPRRPGPGSPFKFYIGDIGSGIDLDKVVLTVDNKTVAWDIDPDYGFIEILPHNPIWGRGRHRIFMQVEDRAGNASRPLIHYYSI